MGQDVEAREFTGEDRARYRAKVRRNLDVLAAMLGQQDFSVPDPHVGKEGFLDVFGRPSRESPCECERRSDFSLPQALNLVNGRTISGAVADPKGRVTKLILSGVDDKKVVEELYLSALGRMPAAAESAAGAKYLAGPGGRASRAQDLLWALLNSKEFMFNQ